MKVEQPLIWTIGHSTRSLEEFILMLQSCNIQVVADIRSFPGSRKFPHFNKEVLAETLPGKEIQYVHIKDLGGRRKANPNSKNTGWRHIAFRSYADYMETETSRRVLKNLEKIASEKRTAFMCSEAVWWRCHRSMVADFLKLHGWKVLHIMGIDKITEHAYTAPARVLNGELNYEKQH